MILNDLINSESSQQVRILKKEFLTELLQFSEIVFEKDTCISDYIRILKYQGYFLTQEISDKGELILRRYHNYQDARTLVDAHLKTYDQMWDGCGCKINYYS